MNTLSIMIRSPLHPTYKFRTNVRPVKHAYLIRENDQSALTRVMRLCCTQWGGIRNLIIPVTEDDRLERFNELLVRLNQPDRFISFLDDKSSREANLPATLAESIQALLDGREAKPLGGEWYLKHDSTSHVLEVVPHNTTTGTCMVVRSTPKSAEDELHSLILFGDIFPGQEKAYEARMKLRSHPSGICGNRSWNQQFATDHFDSVLNLTGYGVQVQEVVAQSMMSLLDDCFFDVVFSDSLHGLCLFWNLRASKESYRRSEATGRRTFLFPSKFAADRSSLEAMTQFIRAHIPVGPALMNVHINFRNWNKDEGEQLETLLHDAEGLELLKDGEVHASYRTAPDESVVDVMKADAPLSYTLNQYWLPERYLEGVSREIAHPMALNDGENEVLRSLPSPIENQSGGEMVFDLDCEIWRRFPQAGSVAKIIRPGGYFSRYGLSAIERQANRPEYVTVDIPDEWSALTHYFEALGYTIRPGRAGQYADGVVDLIGGLSSVAHLASKAAYLLLDTLAVKSTKKLAQRIITQANLEGIDAAQIQSLLEDTEIVPELKRIPKTTDKLRNGKLASVKAEIVPTLDSLTRNGIVNRGLHLGCPRCGTPAWHTLKHLSETVECQGCLATFPVPVEKPKGKEIQWEYMLNALVNRVMDQDALPAVLALYHLTRDIDASCQVLGLEILKNNQVHREFDFLFVSDQKLHAGECKSGSTLAKKDIETARVALELGIKHFRFCTVKRFDDEATSLIEAFREELKQQQRAMTVEILSGDDLLGNAID